MGDPTKRFTISQETPFSVKGCYDKKKIMKNSKFCWNIKITYTVHPEYFPNLIFEILELFPRKRIFECQRDFLRSFIDDFLDSLWIKSINISSFSSTPIGTSPQLPAHLVTIIFWNENDWKKNEKLKRKVKFQKSPLCSPAFFLAHFSFSRCAVVSPVIRKHSPHRLNSRTIAV